ncbi:acyltransferase family protein [Microbacterium sp. NPDC055988]|uniref:acyltransferase family protein n=1 Tax=Microbacterium sp. NPDC055988 TaxID=3345671 RepID=UPI0035DF67B1
MNEVITPSADGETAVFRTRSEARAAEAERTPVAEADRPDVRDTAPTRRSRADRSTAPHAEPQSSTDSIRTAKVKTKTDDVVKPGLRFDAVDGMRGVAILSVLLYHCGWSTRGLFGVDAFFVVSGFLITLLMIKEAVGTGRIRIGAFYARRARRLLPSLFLTLGLVLAVLWSSGTLTELKSAAQTAIASLFQVANWQQIGSNSGYWDQTGQIIPLGQMWSLSVTEQFYVVWPIVVLLLWFVSRKRIGILATLLTVTLFFTALIAPLQFDGSNTDRLYLGTDSRIVAFVAGAAAAALVYWLLQRAAQRPERTPSLLARVGVTTLSLVSLVAVVAVSIATETYHEAWLYQGGLAAVAVGIAIFTATLCFPANALVKPFSYKPFRVVGMVSYSMFLLHLPIFWALQQATDGKIHPLALFVVGGFLTWIASMILHWVIAEPLRTRNWKPFSAFIAIVAGFAVVIGLAWYLPIDRVNNPRVDASAPQAANPGSLFPSGAASTVPTSADGSPLTVAVIGDSVAGNMYDSLAEYRTADLKPLDLTYGGCGIFDAEKARADNGFIMESERLCWNWKDKLRTANADQQPDVYVLHNAWDADDQLFNGEWVGPCTDQWQQRYASQLEMLVDIGDEQAQAPLILLSNDRDRGAESSLSAERLACKTSVEETIMQAHPNVKRLDFKTAVCPDGVCVTETETGDAIYTDGSHFSPAGLARMAPWLQSEMSKALRPSA